MNKQNCALKLVDEIILEKMGLTRHITSMDLLYLSPTC